MNPIKNELYSLLNELDQIAKSFEEIGDTSVREQMIEVIFNTFLKPSDNYVIPDKFGMFSDKANNQVKIILENFIIAIKPKIGSYGLKTPEERLNAFQDENIESIDGMYFDDYFSYLDKI